MNRTIRKLIILMLAFFLVFPVAPLANVLGDELHDIRGHWAQQEISDMYEKGLVRGYGDGTFRPDASISRVEFVILVNRIFGFSATTDIPFTDVDESYPFYPEILKAFAQGYIKGYPDGTFRVDQPITREEAAVMLAAAFHLEPSDVPVTNLSDVESLRDWSKGAVRALVHAGYLKGYPDGTFRGSAAISRSETVKLLSEIAGEVLNQPGTYEGLNVRNVVINKPGVVLQNSVIEGDLYLAEGIGEGDVTLHNVTVRGTVHVEGGGANSVHVIDSTISRVVVDKQTGTVRIAILGSSSIEQIFVITGVKLEVTEDDSGARVETIVLDERMIENASVELSGTFGTVEVRALTEPEIKLLHGIIEHLIANQKIKLHVDAEGRIDDLLNNTEDVITITGDGQVTVNPESKGKVEGGSQPSTNLPVPVPPVPPTPPTPPDEKDDEPPSEVSNVVVVSGDGQLTISWTDPADDDLESIHITGAGSTVIEEVYVDAKIQSHTFTGLDNGVTYKFRISTIDKSGNESTGIIVSGTPVDSTPPGEIRDLNVINRYKQLHLFWVEPNDEDLAQIRLILEGDTVSSTVYVDKGTNVYKFTDLEPFTTYKLHISTIDESGNISEGVTSTEFVDHEHPIFQNVSVHDPSIIVADGKYYVFGTHIEAARSDDLMRWDRFTNGYTTPGNALFGDLSANLAESFAWAGEDDADSKGGYSVWAPDVIWVDDFDNGDGTTGAYLMYYSVSSTYIRSAIGIAASKNIEGPYEYVDTIIYSGFTLNDAFDADSDVNKNWRNTHLPQLIAQNIIEDVRSGWFNASGGYNNSMFPNAIDPTLFYDEHGTLWMTYGSWSGGIFLLEIDPTTGLPIYPGVDGTTEDGRMIDRYFGAKIAGGYTKSGEGPYIVYDPTTGYYYLYVTYGRLGSDGEYNMRMFRAEKPEGPYLDASGQNAVLPGNVSNHPYGNKLIGHFQVPRLPGEQGSLDSWGYVSPGHNSAYIDPVTGEHFLIFHSRFPGRGEGHEVRVHQMFYNEDNWLVVSPSRYAGERLVPMPEELISGEYKYLNHGKENTTTLNYPTYITLHEDHTISSGASGETIGSWTLRGDYYAEITIDDQLYKGVFVRGWDPISNQFVVTFTALSDQGQNIWGMRFSDTMNDSVVISRVYLDLELGDTFDLTWDLQLPTKGTKGATIQWQSSNESVITSDGKITRPEAGEPPGTATLTATIIKGGSSTTKTFDVTVKPRIPAELVARYTFDDDLSDDLGNYADGTITGDRITNTGGQITFNEGVIDQAAVFDGQSGIRLPDGLIQGYEYSVALWLNPDQLTNFTTSFFGARDTDNWISLNPHGWSDTAMLWSGTAWYDAVSDVTLPIGEWTHLAFTVYNGEVHLYVNGERKFSGENFPHIFHVDNAEFALGVNHWDLPFKGLIDDLRIYTGALTAEQVNALIIQPEAKVEKIVFGATEVDLFVDEIYTPARVNVYPVYAPNRSIVWSSSDEAVATVDPLTGHVRGIATGTAEIIATAQDGSGITASYTVNVLEGVLAPVAYYSFDDTLEDAVTGQAGTATGDRADHTGGNITFAPGISGQAAVFDGQSGIRLRDDLITGNEYTVIMSVYMDAENIYDHVYTSAFFGAQAPNSWISFTPIGHPDVNHSSTLWSGEAWYLRDTGVQIANRTWADIAFTVNHGQLKIYIDGEFVFSGDSFPDIFRTGSAVFTLGVNYWDRPFKGLIDELRIYNKALNKETIDLIFLESKMPKPTAHFTFDDNLDDAIDSGRSGTVIGVERNAEDTAYHFGTDVEHGEITYAQGVQGQAAVFNGESGMFLPGGLIQSDRYTVSMWLNPDQLTKYTTTLFAALDGENWISLQPYGWAEQTMLWARHVTTEPIYFDGLTETTAPVGEWTHVAFTVDGSHVKIYVNSELKYENQPSTLPDLFTGKSPFYTLGVNWWDIPYKGKIDELRIYDTPLKDEEVFVLYSARK